MPNALARHTLKKTIAVAVCIYPKTIQSWKHLKKIAIFFGLFLFIIGAGCSVGWMIYLKEWVALAGSMVTIGFAIPTVIALVKKLIA